MPTRSSAVATWSAGPLWSNEPFAELNARGASARRAVARYAALVRRPVVLLARGARRDRVLGVVPIGARRAR